MEPVCSVGTGALAQAGNAPRMPISDDPPSLPPCLPLPAQRAWSRRVGQRHPMQSLCECIGPTRASRAGGRGRCGIANEGHSWPAPTAGAARQCTLFGMRGGWGDDEEMASERSGARRPQGALGARVRAMGGQRGPWEGRGGHGRAEGEDM